MINGGIYLLAIRGTLNKTVLDEVRTIHNETAGSPPGVAAARALGDLSHNVYVPLGDAPDAASELLILDSWTSVDGLRTFFSDPQVQAGGGLIFKDRDSAVWSLSEMRGFVHPTPKDKPDRYVGIIRGTVRSREAAREVFDGMVNKTINASRMLGHMSHQMYWRATPPNEQPSLELIGVDVWYDGEGMKKFYAEATKAAGAYDVFVSQPATSIWKQPQGQWVEW
jgi:hypothetical protein